MNLDYTLIKSTKEQKNILIILHGYGTNKHDLEDVAYIFKMSMDNTTFILPNAPLINYSLENSYFWFPLSFDETNKATITDFNSIKLAGETLDKFIENVKDEYNIPYEKIALLGFSQGGIMALYNGLCLEKNFAAIVAHSSLFHPYGIPEVKRNILPTNFNQNILLVHGKKDPVISYLDFEKTKDFLDEHAIKYESHSEEGLEHSLNENSLTAAKTFLQKHLG